MDRLFGTDGARGVAVTELTCETVMNIGRAFAAVLLKGETVNSPPAVIIGKDTRISSDIMEAAFVAGLTSAGADAVLVEIVPTPAVAYFVRKYEADGGVMISASHNPIEFNGIKLFNKEGLKLSDALEDEIEALVKAPGSIALKSGGQVGRVSSRRSAISDYNFDLQRIAHKTLDGIKVLVDCANGCAGVPAAEVFANLGADCALVNNSPNGMNINLNCGSTNMEEFSRKVVENRFNVGLAFDGDADRCLAVDEQGNIVDGDKIIALLSLFMKQRGKLAKDTAVVTVMSNLGFHRFMKSNGLNTVQVQVGDRNVIEKMLEEGYSIGGEQSGHIIFTEHATTGDGMITAIKLLCMLKERATPLSALAAAIPVFPQVLKNVAIAPGKKGTWETNPQITAAINEITAIAGSDARVLVRESGTEPFLRIMIEGGDITEITQWADKIRAAAEKELS
ncbi:MAG: phosphoglucosamine mutase [Oscillospiraceae bacterium]|jgi:phosphoglucosamine mutase|nr:phosphoglucosamine mutase [Oscillospiraceae bacterium]